MCRKYTFRPKEGFHEKPIGRAAQAAGNQTGGTGKCTGGIPANHRLIGKWTVHSIHSFGAAEGRDMDYCYGFLTVSFSWVFGVVVYRVLEKRM